MEKQQQPIVDVCTRIEPLKSQSLSWKFANFDLVLNGKVNSITQNFGPFFDNSVELMLSLHNNNSEKAGNLATFTLGVEVNKLKDEAKLNKMNLCGQIGMENWNHNFLIELKGENKGSTTFEFPTNILREETILEFKMQYLSRQYRRLYVLNSKDNNDLIKKEFADNVEVKTRSREQQTDTIVPRSKTQIRKNSKWTSTNMITETEERFIPLIDENTKEIDQEKYIQTSKSTKEKWQQTINDAKPKPKPKTKNASTDTLKFQKSKYQQTAEFLLTSIQNKVPASQKSKFQQTDNFLFINLDSEIKSAIERLDIDLKTKSKIENFIDRISQMTRLREINCVLSAEVRTQMVDEFIQKVVNLIDSPEKSDWITETTSSVTDEKTAEEISQNSFTEKKANSVLTPFFSSQAKIVQCPARHKQLLDRIDEVRKEITQESEYRKQDAENEFTELSVEHKELSRLIHQIVRYICMNSVDPVRLASYENELREYCKRIDLMLQAKPDHPHSNYKQGVFSVQQNLNSQLAPWRIFLNHLKTIQVSHECCKEILDSLYGINDIEMIKMLEDIDLNLKETYDRIVCCRTCVKYLTPHVRGHILELEDEQSKLEASCCQKLASLRLFHGCYPFAGPWISKRYINGIDESSENTIL